MNRKAQVSIFIIIGAILLIAAGLIFYTTTREKGQEISPGVFVSIQEVPVELDPVSNFVSACLDDVSTTGIKLIGEHGGYIDPDNAQLSKQTFKISNNPTESDAVIFAPGGNLKIPYWFYLESNNECTGTCKFTSKQPALREKDNSIEKQLNRYIEQELPNCINNFESLEQQGFQITELSEIKIDTRIAESDIVVILDYEIKAKKEDVTSSISQFFVRIPVNLQKIYNLATEISNLQQQFRFLERHTMNLIASFGSVDENKLPPISDIRFEFGSTTSWRRSEVEDKIGQILTSYISLFQVDGTKNFNRDFYSSELKQRIYDSMIVPVADTQYSDLDVNFNYLDFWPLYFDINCNGEICEPESVSTNLLAFIGLQRYNFVYDVSFPVLVEIFDEQALNNRGYKFNFFLESNVRNNEELPTNFVPLQAANTPQTSFLCNLDNRNSADVTVNAKDSLTSSPLKDVSVTLSVLDESCFIGTTDETGSLVTKFPTGTAGAVVSLIKQDYLSKFQLLDAKADEETSLEAELDPILTKKIIVKKKLVEKTNGVWEFTGKESNLGQNEEAIVTLTRISPLTEEDFSAVTSLQGPNPGEIRIAPGVYEVNINLFLKENLRIPEQKQKVVTGLFGLIDQREITYPGIEFNADSPYPSGGLMLTITLTKQDLEKDTIVLYAVSPALQNVPESQRSILDLEQTANIEDYSTVYASSLKPTFQ